MQLPDGMYFYEFVLLLLGSLLFLTLLVLLIVFAVQKRSMKGLLAFFPIPIIMIGFPSYQKISYDNGVVSLEKLTREVSANPQDETARKELQQGIEDVSDRAGNDPGVMLKVGQAHAALGDTLKALAVAETVYQKDSTLPDLKKLISRYQAPLIRINQQVDEAGAGTKDTAALKTDLKKLEQSGSESPAVLMTQAKIRISLGDTAEANRLADSAAKVYKYYPAAPIVRFKPIKR